jgi:hypothetical protein
MEKKKIKNVYLYPEKKLNIPVQRRELTKVTVSAAVGDGGAGKSLVFTMNDVASSKIDSITIEDAAKFPVGDIVEVLFSESEWLTGEDGCNLARAAMIDVYFNSFDCRPSGDPCKSSVSTMTDVASSKIDSTTIEEAVKFPVGDIVEVLLSASDVCNFALTAIVDVAFNGRVAEQTLLGRNWPDELNGEDGSGVLGVLAGQFVVPK